MLSNKNFWLGFLAAYALAIFLPPTRILSMGKKSG